jgi:hypothetical protein
MAGRPYGAMDFYINLIDNPYHGPYGQDPNSPAADPCFGTILEGRQEVLNLAAALPTGDQMGFLDRDDWLRIESVRVI